MLHWLHCWETNPVLRSRYVAVSERRMLRSRWNSRVELSNGTSSEEAGEEERGHFHKSNDKWIHGWGIVELSSLLPNVVQLMIWLRRGRPCFSCKLERVRDGTYAHTATWSICTVWEPRLYFFFRVIHTFKCNSKSLWTLPGGQTAVCQPDEAWFSAPRWPGSRLKWGESAHHRRSWDQCYILFYFRYLSLKYPLASRSARHCGDDMLK